MKKVVGVIFTLLIIAGGILFAIKSGLLMKPSDKVFLAAANTIVDQGEMVKALKGLTILSEDEFTVNMTETNGEHNRTTQLAVTPDEKQLTQKIHYLVNLLLVQKEVDLQYTVSLDQQYVKIAIPEVTDKIIVYDYMEDLQEAAGITEGTDETTKQIQESMAESDPATEFLNGLSEEIYSYFYRSTFETTLGEIATAAWNMWSSLEFERADKTECYVDGETIECRGYKTVVRGSDLWLLIDQAERILKENYGLDEEFHFSKWKEKYGNISDLHMTFYIYKDQIACIKVNDIAESFSIEIALQGGATRMQNMTITENGQLIWKMEGSTAGSMESATITDTLNGVKSFTYDVSTGNYTYAKDGESRVGTLINTEDSMKITVDEKYVNGEKTEETSEITLSKGAQLEAMEGEMLSVNEMMDSEIFVAVQTFFETVSRVVNNIFGAE
ncbi:MAG: hypothetical protein U0L12_05860 [Ruminococcus sp.]|nr:hypothetical protein [Ruminococcus sp.]